jgi:hypothetical protein
MTLSHTHTHTQCSMTIVNAWQTEMDVKGGGHEAFQINVPVVTWSV